MTFVVVVTYPRDRLFEILKVLDLGSKANMGLNSSNEQVKIKVTPCKHLDLFGPGIETDMGLKSSNEHVNI